jgi:hypothetical protein
MIPARDEADRVKATVETVRALPSVDRVIVIDDGSTDDTATLAAEAGAHVLRLTTGAGKGDALNAGLGLLGSDDTVLLLDADLGTSASHAEDLLEPVLAGHADMTVATFPRPPHKAGFGLVKGLARRGIRVLGHRGFVAAAPLSGQRALAPEALRAVAPFASGYGVEVACTIKALRAGVRVLEVPTQMTHAHSGRDLVGFVHRGRQLLHVARALARLAFERLSGPPN